MIRALADGGRLATITSDPPPQERAITVSNVYVRPDGGQLRDLAQQLADGRLEIPLARTCWGFSMPSRRLRLWSAGAPAERSLSLCRRGPQRELANDTITASPRGCEWDLVGSPHALPMILFLQRKLQERRPGPTGSCCRVATCSWARRRG